MAEFKLKLRSAIMHYALINIRRLIAKKGGLTYEEKCCLLIAIMQYVFAFYALYGSIRKGTSDSLGYLDGDLDENVDDVDVTVVMSDFINEFSYDEDVKSKVIDMIALRNRIAHSMYVPATMRNVNTMWNRGNFKLLCDLIESGIPYNDSKKKNSITNPADIMAGENK